jgi:hypothetical protein
VVVLQFEEVGRCAGQTDRTVVDMSRLLSNGVGDTLAIVVDGGPARQPI